jgi:alpha-L-fucosidase
MPHIAPWFPNAKLGIFVHWGVFSTMFDEHEEHPWNSRGLPPDEYRRRAGLLSAEHFDMAEWASLFKRWGARYAVLTTRHAQGFALWDTKVDDRSIVRMSPYGKDMVARWCDGLRDAGLKVGLYFCHRDWGDDNFRAVMDREEFQAPDQEARERAWRRYLETRDAKLDELLTGYGKIDLFWADEDWGRTAEQLQSEAMAALIERRQPGIVMNNRFHHPWIGHYCTPEQKTPIHPVSAPFELCDTLVKSRHWQYLPGERAYVHPRHVIRTFIDVISLGGNYLINIGPAPDGRIPRRETEILDTLGEFCRINAEAIYDTHAGVPRTCFGGGSTVKGNALYLFAVDRPRDNMLMFRGVKNPIQRVTHLASGAECRFERAGQRGAGYYWFETPEDDGSLPAVYKVEFEGARPEIA